MEGWKRRFNTGPRKLLVIGGMLVVGFGVIWVLVEQESPAPEPEVVIKPAVTTTVVPLEPEIMLSFPALSPANPLKITKQPTSSVPTHNRQVTKMKTDLMEEQQVGVPPDSNYDPMVGIPPSPHNDPQIGIPPDPNNDPRVGMQPDPNEPRLGT